jgi:type IV secretory pathway component VirB8
MSQFIPGLVYTTDLLKQAVETEKFVNAQVKRQGRSLLGWRVYAGTMTMMVFLLGGTLNYTIPMIRLIPILLWQRPDGIVETALTPDSLSSVAMTDRNIQAWLWQYVQHAEGYSWVEAETNHYIVNAMSSVPVRRTYDAWFSGKNPNSYQVVYGKTGVVRVAWRETPAIGFQRARGNIPGKITFHFDRQVAIDSMPPQPVETWTASLEYVEDYNKNLKVQDITMFNPSQIVVTSYPGGRPMPPVASGVSR